MDLKSNQKSIGYSYNIPTTILPMGTSCQPGNCFMSQGSQLVKTVDAFSPPETYIGPTSKMCGVFCDRVLPSNSAGQPRAAATACVVWVWGIQDS